MENVTAAVPERPNNKEKKVFEREVIMGCEMVLDISATHLRIFILLRPEVLPNVHFENILQVIQDLLHFRSRDLYSHTHHPFGGRPNGRPLLFDFRI